MKIKQIAKLLIILILMVSVVGCGSEEKKETPTSQSTTSNQEQEPITNLESYDKGYLEVSEEDSKGLEVKECTRSATGENNAEVKPSIQIQLFDILNVLSSDVVVKVIRNAFTRF